MSDAHVSADDLADHAAVPAALRGALERAGAPSTASSRLVCWVTSSNSSGVPIPALGVARAAGHVIEVLCADDACARALARALGPSDVPVRAVTARLAPALRAACGSGVGDAPSASEPIAALSADLAFAPPRLLYCAAGAVEPAFVLGAMQAGVAMLAIVFEHATMLSRLPADWWSALAASPRVRLLAAVPDVAAAVADALAVPPAWIEIAEPAAAFTALAAAAGFGGTPDDVPVVSLRRRLLRAAYTRAVTHPLGSAVAERARQSRWVSGDTAVAPALAGRAQAAAPTVARRPGAALRVTHHIGSLGAGGSERQLLNLVAGSVARGHDVRVLTSVPVSGGAGHFAPALRALGVVPEPAGSRVPAALWSLLDGPSWAATLGAVPRVMRAPVRALLGSLLLEPPDVLHGWLDLTNIWSGVGGLLADVPALVLGTRSLNPSRFPALAHPWFRDWYRLLARSPRVRLTANSHVGAADYAAWLGVAADRFDVILNGIDTAALPRADDATAATTRAGLGIPADAPLLLGVLRLSDEKRPELWLDTALETLRRLPRAHALLAGDGPRAARLARRLARHPAGSRVQLLGRRQDIPALMAASDVLLLTSRAEGLPNVLLEAQWAGCAVVTTAAGGAVDALNDGVTGCVVRDARAGPLAAAVVALLDDPARLAELRTAAPMFVARRFGLARMIDEHLALYARMLG